MRGKIFFVEVGANDGVTISNTVNLEKNMLGMAFVLNQSKVVSIN
jgi:hypothetical protein